MRKKYTSKCLHCILFILIFYPSIGFSQQYKSFTGLVLSERGIPVKNTLIAIKVRTEFFRAKTDDSGRFELKVRAMSLDPLPDNIYVDGQKIDRNNVLFFKKIKFVRIINYKPKHKIVFADKNTMKESKKRSKPSLIYPNLRFRIN